MAISELYKWIKTSKTGCGLYFYRTRSGFEIDCILETPAGIIGIEIKSRNTVVKKDSANLIRFSENLHDKKWLGGMIVYSGNKIEKMDEPDIWAVPAKRLYLPISVIGTRL